MDQALYDSIQREGCTLRDLVANDPGSTEERRRVNRFENKRRKLGAVVPAHGFGRVERLATSSSSWQS